MSKKQCLTPKCTEEPKTRGLCITCYHAARRLLKRRGKTWADLEAVGRALPKTRAETAFYKSSKKLF